MKHCVCDCGWEGDLATLTALTICPACTRRGRLSSIPALRKPLTGNAAFIANKRAAKLRARSGGEAR